MSRLAPEHCVDANSLVDKLRAEGTGKCAYSTLSHGVVWQFLRPLSAA